MNIQLAVGRISKNLKVLEATIRMIDETHSEHPEEEGFVSVARPRLQARLENVTRKTLHAVKCDVSYYSKGGQFLGLDLSYWPEVDTIAPEEVLPIDIELQIPDETERCVFNVHAKKGE